MHNITLSEAALKQATQLHSEPQNTNLSLRLYLDGKGCDGFFYGVTFDEQGDEDLHTMQENINIVVDPDTYTFCKGSVIEWVDDDRGQGFLVENPNHKKFRGKFYKRQSWQKALTEKQKT